MATARGFGAGAGRLVGATGALVWTGVTAAATAAGEAGSGFVEAVPVGYDEKMAQLAKAAELRKQKALAAREALAAKGEAVQAVAPLVPVASV